MGKVNVLGQTAQTRINRSSGSVTLFNEGRFGKEIFRLTIPAARYTIFEILQCS